MTAPNHIVMIVPASQRDALNRCGAAMNYGPTNFSRALVTPPDLDTVTHYFCDAPGSDGFVAILQAAKAGTLPPGIAWEDFDLTEDEARAAFAASIFDALPYAEGQERAHCEAIIEAQGLANRMGLTL